MQTNIIDSKYNYWVFEKKEREKKTQRDDSLIKESDIAATVRTDALCYVMYLKLYLNIANEFEDMNIFYYIVSDLFGGRIEYHVFKG